MTTGKQLAGRPPREDVTPSGVAALRMAADNMPLGRQGAPWEGAADWLRRRADAIEQHVTSPEPTCPDCGHADREHYALGHVGCHDLRCQCARVAPQPSGASDGE